MTEFLQFAILGLGLCAIYTLLSLGLTVIYGGSGVLNFSHAAMAMLGAYIYFEARSIWGWSFWPSFLLAVALITLLGVLVYHLVMRPLRNASTVAKAIASLGVLILIQGYVAIEWAENPRNVNPIFPTTFYHPFDKTSGGTALLIPTDRLYMVVIALGLTALLWAAYRFSSVGLAIRASAENQRAAATIGWSPHLLATVTWGLGAGLAAVAGVIIAPISGINPEEFPYFILPVLAAALLGGFTSFWVIATAAFVIGTAQTEWTNYGDKFAHWLGIDGLWFFGTKTSFPFLVIILLLAVKGQGLPARGQVLERLAELGNGIIRVRTLSVILVGYVLAQIFWFRVDLTVALTVSFGWAIVMLSVVLLLGYAGQLSLAQFAIAGLAALFAAKLVSTSGWPFELAMLVAILLTIPIGIAFALPALRTRGINLAVVTLGLALSINAMVLNNIKWVGAEGDTHVGPQKFFGINIDPYAHPVAYTLFAFVFFVLCALSVASIRRGVVGRRLIAVRTNERAAAALGISVFGVKLYAFGLAAAIAGLGGVVLAFRNQQVVYTDFVPLQSILAVAYAVIGGIGFVLGAPFGSQVVQGGFGTWLLDTFPYWGLFVLGLILAALGANSLRGLLRKPEAGKRRSLLAPVAAVLPLALGVLGLVLGASKGVDHGWRDSIFTNPNPSWLVVVGGVTVILLIVIHPDGAISVNAHLFRTAGEKLRARVRPGDVKAGPPPLPDVPREPVKPGNLTASGITVRFGGVVAVNDVSVEVHPGEVVGLIGPNGAGKTTLIDAITGFVKPAAGTVVFNDVEIGAWPVFKRARAGVSRSFQQLELFESSTVRENLMVASDGYSHRPYLTDIFRPTNPPLSSTATAAVKELELEQYLDTRVSDLPYGRRRLVAIARAIAVAPSILLLDEPAAGLSGAETAELVTVVKRLAQEWQLGILVIEHDMSFVMGVCDRITVLDFGRQIATGTPTEIRKDPAVVSAYLGEEADAEPAHAAATPPPSLDPLGGAAS